MTTPNTEHARELLAAATPGPWFSRTLKNGSHSLHRVIGKNWGPIPESEIEKVSGGLSKANNAALIVHMVNHAEEYIAAVEAVERVRFTLNGWADGQIDDPYAALKEALEGETT